MTQIENEFEAIKVLYNHGFTYKMVCDVLVTPKKIIKETIYNEFPNCGL